MCGGKGLKRFPFFISGPTHKVFMRWGTLFYNLDSPYSRYACKKNRRSSL